MNAVEAFRAGFENKGVFANTEDYHMHLTYSPSPFEAIRWPVRPSLSHSDNFLLGFPPHFLRREICRKNGYHFLVICLSPNICGRAGWQRVRKSDSAALFAAMGCQAQAVVDAPADCAFAANSTAAGRAGEPAAVLMEYDDDPWFVLLNSWWYMATLFLEMAFYLLGGYHAAKASRATS